jgi:Core-2/I-Branching enzyme
VAKIGFVVLTYSCPEQLERLLDRLALLYNCPPVSLHHDFGKCNLPFTLNGQVRVVRPHLNTGWGTASFVRAAFAALDLLYSSSDSPDWCVILSGSDYPSKEPAAVIRDLEEGGCDVYIEQQLIYPGGGATEWPAMARYRYVYTNLRVPLVSRLGLLPDGQLPVRALFSPFSKSFKCVGGSTWFTANRSAIEQLLRWNTQHPEFLDYCNDRPCVDEMVFHTIFGNLNELRKPALSGIPQTFRYIDWSAGGPHPKELGIEDLSLILASGAHFARKFAHGDPVLDVIDENLGLPKWR